MPKKKNPNEKAAVVESVRRAEYYGIQETFDDLYRKSLTGEMFDKRLESQITHM